MIKGVTQICRVAIGCKATQCMDFCAVFVREHLQAQLEHKCTKMPGAYPRKSRLQKCGNITISSNVSLGGNENMVGGAGQRVLVMIMTKVMFHTFTHSPTKHDLITHLTM